MNFPSQHRVVAVVAGDYHYRDEVQDALVLAVSEAFSPTEIGSGRFDWSRVLLLVAGPRSTAGRHVLAYAEKLGMAVELFAPKGYARDSAKAVRLIRRAPAALLVVGPTPVGVEAVASARRNSVPIVTCGLEVRA